MHVTKSKDELTIDLVIAVLQTKDFLLEDAVAWRRKYNNLKSNARLRDSECLLSFKQYMTLVKRAGITEPSQIGSTKGKYQMSRKGDAGNYEIGNCRFLTLEDNLDEKYKNGGYARQSEKRTGWTKENHAGVASMARAQAKRTKSNDKGRLEQSIKVSKDFEVVSPKGKTYRGRNLSAFCQKHGLTHQLMSSVCRQTAQTHKGWTGSYLTQTTRS